jgi:hypothetical protein
MKLKITRDQEQKKGLLGGNKGIEFTLRCQADLTSDEKALVDKAQIGEYVLTTYRPHEDGMELSLTVKDIMNGVSSRVKNVQKLLKLEDEIVHGCQNLKSLLEVIGTFGGEEVIEI